MTSRTRSYIVFFAFILLIPTSFGLILAFSCGPFSQTLPAIIFTLVGFGLSVLTAGSVIGSVFALFRLFASHRQGSEPVISGNLGRYFIAAFGLVLVGFVITLKKVCS